VHTYVILHRPMEWRDEISFAADRAQFGARPFGERPGAHRAEGLVGGAQLVPAVAAALLATQPPAVELADVQPGDRPPDQHPPAAEAR
jgi:hypothetical protein